MAKPRTAAKRVNPMLVVTLMAPDGLEPAEAEISETGGPTAVACTPERTAVPSSDTVASEPPIAIAAAWNASKVFTVVGALILPTMPIPQCRGCLQKYQMGFVSVILMVKVDEDTKLESNPAEVLAEAFAARYVHGSLKLD